MKIPNIIQKLLPFIPEDFVLQQKIPVVNKPLIEHNDLRKAKNQHVRGNYTQLKLIDEKTALYEERLKILNVKMQEYNESYTKLLENN